MNKRLKKIVSLLAATSLLLTQVAVVYGATDDSSAKEEVIYANLTSDGSVSEAYAVNIFNGSGNIVDYGDYSSVVNMNTSDEIKIDDGKITISTDANRLYYEGYLDNAQMPWNINIHYYLDGSEVTADNIAGASGHLKITIDVAANPGCDSDFFNSYALQTTVLLDSTLCENIKTTGATEANVGSNKQLLYTSLPGKSKSISVEADVTDFQMDAITFNGVRMNLGLNSDTIDTSEITNRLDLLSQATNSLYSGSSSLYSGTNSLQVGATNLTNGIYQTQNALSLLSANSSALTTNSANIGTGISSLYNGLNLMSNGIANYESALSSSSGGQITTIESAKTTTDTTISQLQAAISSGALDSSTVQLYTQIIALLQAGSGSEEVLAGFKNQLNPTYSAGGVPSLMYGATTLNNNYSDFNDGLNTYTSGVDTLATNYSSLTNGADTLLAGADTLNTGASSLVNGTYEFKTSVDGIDINGSIDNMLSNLTGSDIAVKSFVSDKNANISSVQFVIKTDEIKTEKVVTETKEDTNSKSLWDKIVGLFK